MVTLYGANASPFVRKVMAVLAIQARPDHRHSAARHADSVLRVFLHEKMFGVRMTRSILIDGGIGWY